MKKIFTILSIGFISLVAQAQTNPAPFDMSTGNYSFTQWDNTSAAGTYPANMVFHMTSNTSDYQKKKKINDFLNDYYSKELEKYLNETPREQILKDWEKTSDFDNVGITVNDFFNHINQQVAE
jgi:hypothetical protein